MVSPSTATPAAATCAAKCSTESVGSIHGSTLSVPRPSTVSSRGGASPRAQTRRAQNQSIIALRSSTASARPARAAAAAKPSTRGATSSKGATVTLPTPSRASVSGGRSGRKQERRAQK